MKTTKGDLGPDGMRMSLGAQPDGMIGRAAEEDDVEGHSATLRAEGIKSLGAQPDGMIGRAAEEDDVEGHSTLLNPTITRDVMKARNADIERSVRAKQNESEAKRIFRR